MKKIILWAVFVLTSTMLYAAENPWKQRIDDQGITVHTRKVDGSAMLEFKSEAVIPAPLEQVITRFEDEAGLCTWYYQCGEARLLRDEGPNVKVMYMVLNLPWPVAKRDTIFRRTKSIDGISGAVSYSIEALPNEIPAEKGKVRVLSINSVWRFTPQADGTTTVYFQQHSNPGGSIPAMLVNQLVKDIPYHSLKNLRAFVQQKK